MLQLRVLVKQIVQRVVIVPVEQQYTMVEHTVILIRQLVDGQDAQRTVIV